MEPARNGGKITFMWFDRNLVPRVSLLCLPCRWEESRFPTTREAEERDPGNEVGLTGSTGLRHTPVSYQNNAIEVSNFFFAFLLLTERKTDRPFKFSLRNLEMHYMS